MPKSLLSEAALGINYLRNDLIKRRAVLRDTVEKFKSNHEKYKQLAEQNHLKWLENKDQQDLDVNTVSVVEGDWGDVALNRSMKNGQIYAVLNMANAYMPGGGYLEGMPAQEENMFRRTDCHFYIKDADLDENNNKYNKTQTNLINAVSGRVYLDINKPRICIKDSEVQPEKGVVEGYNDLPNNQVFQFYELKSAAPDLRSHIGGFRLFNENDMRKRIIAMLQTLIENKIRYTILSAYGCGAFGNPADKVAQIFKEELSTRLHHFDDVVFAIYYPGYGPRDNFDAFRARLNQLSPSLNEASGQPINNLDYSDLAKRYLELANNADISSLAKMMYLQAARINQRAGSNFLWNVYAAMFKQRGTVTFQHKADKINSAIAELKDHCDETIKNAMSEGKPLRNAFHLSTVWLVDKTTAEQELDNCLLK